MGGGSTSQAGYSGITKILDQYFPNVWYGWPPCDRRWREAAPASTGHKVLLEIACLFHNCLFVWQDNFSKKLCHSVSIH